MPRESRALLPEGASASRIARQGVLVLFKALHTRTDSGGKFTGQVKHPHRRADSHRDTRISGFWNGSRRRRTLTRGREPLDGR